MPPEDSAAEKKSLVHRLLLVQQDIGAISKNADNPFFHSKYADLNEILSVVKPILNKHGVLIVSVSGADQFGKFLKTSLVNALGDGEVASIKYFSGKEENMQQLGAADTYSRRFNLMNLLSLETEDDDGETAVGRPKAQAVPAAPSVRPVEHPPVGSGIAAPIGGAHCRLCGSLLKLAKSGKSYYCPNFKDKTLGEHTSVFAEDIQNYIANQDVPF